MSNNRFLYSWLGLCIGVLTTCLLSLFFNEDPVHIFKVLVTSFCNSKFDFGLTLFYTTCFIFSALSFAIPMKAGLFHIGSEGQIIFSGLVAAVAGAIIPYQGIASVLLVFLITLVAGFLAAALIALFKIYRNAHEVVVAIMLNFILIAITTWITVNFMQNPDSQNPETKPIQAGYQFLQNDFLKNYFEQSPVSLFLLLALICCLVLYFLENRTLIGLQIKAVGANPLAAERMQISKKKILIISFGLAGVFSALVGLTEVFGNTFQYKIGFSPQYGFLGIVVALLAQENFIGMIASAFLIACLHKGASDLDLETQFLTRDFSKVLQAVIIFSVASAYYFSVKKIRKKKKVL